MKRPLGSTDVPCSGAGLLPGVLSSRCHRCSHKEKDEHRGQQHAATGTVRPAMSHPAARHGRQSPGGRSKARSPRTSPSPMPTGAYLSPKSVPARPGVSLGAACFGDSSRCYLEPSAGTPSRLSFESGFCQGAQAASPLLFPVTPGRSNVPLLLGRVPVVEDSLSIP